MAFATATTLATTTNFSSARYAAFIQRKLLEWGKQELMFRKFLEEKKLDKGYSTTYTIIRRKRIKIPLVGATEAVTPTAQPLALDTVSGTVTQYVLVVSFSDVTDLVQLHDMITHATMSVADATARLDNKICSDAFMANTNIFYPNASVSARSGLASTDVINTDTVRTAVTFIRHGDRQVGAATPWQGQDLFLLTGHPVAGDMRKDATWEAYAVRQDGDALKAGAVASWEGCQVFVSNMMPEFTNLSDGIASTTLADNTAVTNSSDADGGLNGFKSVSTLNAAGSLVQNTTYNAVVVRVNEYRGFLEDITSVLSVATNNTANHKELDFTMPTEATGKYKYWLYFGSNGGTLYEVFTAQAASAVVAVTAVPTSGNTAPVAPARTTSGTRVKIHPTWIGGKEWGAVVTLDSLKTYITPLAPTPADPAVQNRYVAAKLFMGSFLVRDSYIARIESATAFQSAINAL